ncbi:hypothetical protein NE237_016518 [Protea cynaroides]|uniref:Uncharacterized protein n=1 Tax=Protea cynaroides TaxID=273540 RepID=A0A9Q0K5K5_9MAGN|nr:hypothetical protein NE237_016518 [Protea cynaroides]
MKKDKNKGHEDRDSINRHLAYVFFFNFSFSLCRKLIPQVWNFKEGSRLFISALQLRQEHVGFCNKNVNTETAPYRKQIEESSGFLPLLCSSFLKGITGFQNCFFNSIWRKIENSQIGRGKRLVALNPFQRLTSLLFFHPFSV